MEKVATLGERLRQIMDERELKYESFGNLLDMRPQTINRYVLGRREPKAHVLMDMATRLGVDIRWLQGYDVPQHSAAMPGEWMIPIVGTIRAGGPVIAQEEIEGWAPAAVPSPDGYVYLRVRGDSMINAGIYDGDLALIRLQSTAENGQIVACILDGESATLKRFHRQGDHVILQPENSAYAPRILAVQEFELGYATIYGVAIRLLRDL